MKRTFGTFLLFSALAIACEKKPEVPADADAMATEAGEQVEALKKLSGKLPSSIEQKAGPECGQPKKTLVVSRADLERAFVADPSTYPGFKDGRSFEANDELEPSQWGFPSEFNPRTVQKNLDSWKSQRDAESIGSVRFALEGIRPIEHIAVLVADSMPEGGSMSEAKDGTFTAAKLKALAVVYDKKTLDVVCHATFVVETSKELRLVGVPGEDPIISGRRALNRNLRENLRTAGEERFGAKK